MDAHGYPLPVRTKSRAEMKLKNLVAALPMETPLRRRARESNLVSLSSRDDPVLEEYLHLIHQGAQRFDKSQNMRRHRQATGLDQPIQKQLVYTTPGFGVTFGRDTDTFGMNPIIVVQAIHPDSPAAGLIGLGDQLLAVDDLPVTTMSFREVAKLVAQASERASPEEPHSITFRPVHDGPAEIAAPLKAGEREASPRRGKDDNPSMPRILDMDSIAEGDGEDFDAHISELPPGVEILPHGGFAVTETGDPEGYVQPMYSSTRLPAPLIRLEARRGVRRLPEMWFMTRKGDCGSYIEMEFTQAPMGIVFQGRTVRGTTASSPATVILQPGDKLLTINGVNVESWGRLRVQDALLQLVEGLSPENPKHAVFFRTRLPTGGTFMIEAGMFGSPTASGSPRSAAASSSFVSPSASSVKRTGSNATLSSSGASPRGRSTEMKPRTAPPRRESSDPSTRSSQPPVIAGGGGSRSLSPRSNGAGLPPKVPDSPRGKQASFKGGLSDDFKPAKSIPRLEPQRPPDNTKTWQLRKPQHEKKSVHLKKFEASASVTGPDPSGNSVNGEVPTDYESCSELEAKPVMIRPGSIASMSTRSRSSHGGITPRNSDVAGEEKEDSIEHMLDAHLARDATPADNESTILNRVSEFNGKLVPEELSKLSKAGQEAAKAGAKAGAEAAAVAGAKAGAEEGARIAADKSLYSNIEDLARIAAQRGAILGAQMGARIGAEAGAEAGAGVGASFGGHFGEVEGRGVGSKSGAMAGAKAASWAAAKVASTTAVAKAQEIATAEGLSGVGSVTPSADTQ